MLAVRTANKFGAVHSEARHFQKTQNPYSKYEINTKPLGNTAIKYFHNKPRKLEREVQGCCHTESGGSCGGGQIPPPPHSNSVTDEDDRGSGRFIRVFIISVTLTATIFWLVSLNSGLEENKDEKICKGTVSLIVPVLNEEKCIKQLLNWIDNLDPQPNEIFIVDGGSTDSTVSICQREKMQVLHSGRGRGQQMNVGAKAAKGDFLVFLHADTQPPTDLIRVIQCVLADRRTVAGGLRIITDFEGKRMYLTEFHSLIKSYYGPLFLAPVKFFQGFRLLFGDQIIFCRSKDFRDVGGYRNDIPIMEDADLLLKLFDLGSVDDKGVHRKGRIKLVLNREVNASGRRIYKWGPFKTMFIHFYISLSWYFGATPDRLNYLYNKYYTDAYR